MGKTGQSTEFSDLPWEALGVHALGRSLGDTSPDWIEPIIDQSNGIITLQLLAERYRERFFSQCESS